MTINYPPLSKTSRRQIWETFLGPESAVGEKELDRLAKVNLNGRQIKNVLKTAQMLARSQEQDKNQKRGILQIGHIETILAIGQGTPQA